VRRAALVLVAALAGACAAPAPARPNPAAADPLAPYRALARSPAGARLVALARQAIDAYFRGDAADSLAVPGWQAAADSLPALDSLATPAGAPDWPGPPTGVYVSLVNGAATRACVGSVQPVAGSLRETVRALATQALSADPRHPPVRSEELAGLRVVIAFAGPGEPIADPMSVDPARDGLLIRGARASVAFLPGEARTVSWALREARRLGVIVGSWRDAGYERFAVVTVTEPVGPPPGARAGGARKTQEQDKEAEDAAH
jgi:AMMECR1 domain-containing protein